MLFQGMCKRVGVIKGGGGKKTRFCTGAIASKMAIAAEDQTYQRSSHSVSIVDEVGFPEPCGRGREAKKRTVEDAF